MPSKPSPHPVTDRFTYFASDEIPTRTSPWYASTACFEEPFCLSRTLGLVQGILERLAKGDVILGDGSYVFTLEKRCLVKAGDWTPQASCENPEAVKQLALEFSLAGADITQTFTFYSTDDRLPKDCRFKVPMCGWLGLDHLHQGHRDECLT